MLNKTNFVFPLFLLTLCLFSACEEEEVVTPKTPPIPSIYAHLAGSFYTERTSSYDYSSGFSTFFDNKDTADINLEIAVQDDTLFVLGDTFLINSLNQTSFSKTWRDPYSDDPQELKLDYYNNYDSISFFTSSCGPVNGCRVATYGGIRSANMERQPSADVYTLKVVHREHLAAIDTQYTADLVVNVDGSSFEIGTNLLHYNSFRTYSREYRLSSGSYGSSTKLIYMDNDSLYLDYYETTYTSDTVYYSYQGVKK